MNGHCLTNEQILAFSTALFQAERSQATVDKYLRSVQAFSLFLDGRPVTKDTEKRNRYQKVIICAGCPIFVYGGAISALLGAFSLVGTK